MPAPRPPSADPLVALADQCVQCGLCLPACPTYRQDRLEAESPRGRIALARAWALDTVPPTPAGDAHLDHCLACRQCEAACPAGVRFGSLLVQARERQRARRGAPLRQRAVEWMVARPRRLAFALTAYRRLFPALPAPWRALPRPPAPAPHGASGPDGGGKPRERVALFVGCVARGYEGPLRDALARLLAACGVEVVAPAGQGCCGSLHAHAGDAAGARALGARNASAFAEGTTVLTLASGCHGAVADALPGRAVTDAIAFLAARSGQFAFRPYPGRVALHLPCTQRSTVRSVPALKKLLARVPGLDVRPLVAGTGCCGAAGSAMLLDPARAAGFRAPLLAQAEADGADCILSANIGCRLHLAGATTRPVLHPLEFLAAQLDTRA